MEGSTAAPDWNVTVLQCGLHIHLLLSAMANPTTWCKLLHHFSYLVPLFLATFQKDVFLKSDPTSQLLSFLFQRVTCIVIRSCQKLKGKPNTNFRLETSKIWVIILLPLGMRKSWQFQDSRTSILNGAAALSDWMFFLDRYLDVGGLKEASKYQFGR